MLRMIVCDWNGTLFREPMEETFFLGLCRRAFRRAVLRGRLRQAARLMARGVRCLGHYRAARKHPDRTLEHIGRIIELLNPLAFAGLHRHELAAYVARYARRIQPLLDRRLLDPIAEVARPAGVAFGVVSSGCRRGIEAALAGAGLRADFVLANDFRMDGDVTAGFDFAIGHNKRELLADLLARRGVDPAEVMYIGDSPQDAACLALVGLPVVSFFAAPAAREHLAREHRAFAPPDPPAFAAHLREAIGRRDRGMPSPVFGR